jgi:hypothetical protein
MTPTPIFVQTLNKTYCYEENSADNPADYDIGVLFDQNSRH